MQKVERMCAEQGRTRLLIYFTKVRDRATSGGTRAGCLHHGYSCYFCFSFTLSLSAVKRICPSIYVGSGTFPASMGR